MKDKVKLNFDWHLFITCFKFSTPVLFLLLGYVLLESTDRLILQLFVDLSMVAYYSVGTTIGAVLILIARSMDVAWAPFYYATVKEESEDNAKELFAYASTYFATIIIYLGLFPAIFRHEIIYILAPPSYYPIIKLIPVIMIGAIFSALFFIPVRAIYQHKKTIYLPIIIIIGITTNVALNLILIPKFSILGAALATMIASFILFALCFFISQRLYRVRYHYLRLLKVLGICLACFVLHIVTKDYPLFISFMLNILIMILFPALLLLTRFFEKREINKFIGIIQSYMPNAKLLMKLTVYLK
jgi:O-antigen/teichoic acid export membrane protein